VTRAKKMLIIVGNKGSVLQMVNNNKKTKRYTALCSMLKEQNYEN
jgi:exodeoxyribonuclease V alpha subunit